MLANSDFVGKYVPRLLSEEPPLDVLWAGVLLDVGFDCHPPTSWHFIELLASVPNSVDLGEGKSIPLTRFVGPGGGFECGCKSADLRSNSPSSAGHPGVHHDRNGDQDDASIKD